MPYRAVHFAIDQETEKRLLAAAGDDEAVMAVVEDIEQAWDKDYLAESDKAWEAIHRCLTDGELLYDNGTYPLNRVVCGGRQLYQGDDYTVSFVPAAEVRDVAEVLKPLTAEWFAERYRTVLRRDYSPNYGQDDLDYSWAWFQRIRKLFLKAAVDGRAVIFTVDA